MVMSFMPYISEQTQQYKTAAWYLFKDKKYFGIMDGLKKGL